MSGQPNHSGFGTDLDTSGLCLKSLPLRVHCVCVAGKYRVATEAGLKDF